MKAQGGGKIINIGSMNSLFGDAGVVPYAASKGVVVQLTKVMAVEWAWDNIQVNVILPGWINTDMISPVRDNTKFLKTVVEQTPAHRWGESADFEGPAAFLASTASDFVTGVSLVVDGGYSVKG